jgi:hypothetical protein
MDTPGLVMWIDLVLVPHLNEKQAPEWGSLLVWDGCTAHNTRAVQNTFAEYGIHVRCLPTNMTDYMQVMDLVVNGPFKSRMRAARISELRDYMNRFQVQYWQARANQQKTPVWNPPTMTLTHGLMAALDSLKGMDESEAFRAGMRSCFVKVGLVPMTGTIIDGDAEFMCWTGHVPGNMLKHCVTAGAFVQMLQLQQQNHVALADVIDDVELRQREDDVLEEMVDLSDEEGEIEAEDGESDREIAD